MPEQREGAGRMLGVAVVQTSLVPLGKPTVEACLVDTRVAADAV